MTLFNYLDERFKTLNLELQKEYTIPKEAELKAAYTIIQWQRSFYKYLTMPYLIAQYFMINLGWIKLKELPKKPDLKIVESKEGVTETAQIQ